MKLSVSVTNYSWPEPIHGRLVSLAAVLDGSAVDTLWVADHLVQADPTCRTDEPMLEAYTVLGYLAAATRRIRLGTMVTAATFRAPALLIKAVTTLDVLSNGRAWLGLGAGYNVAEATAMGLFLPDTAQRFADDQTVFRGEYLTAQQPIGNPRPVTMPHPPVLIGGTGERRTLRLVAQYGDACNLFDIPDGGRAIRRQLGVLDRHCAEVGRPADAVQRTVTTALEPGESVARLVQRCLVLGELGVEHVVLITRGRPWGGADLDVAAGAADQLRDRAHTPG
jgi:alkanesulfonate monooxygenase SsuD/methylene tetrahydromethanopterin reductase-like flavin-dependent oxidoreductase (luciferase family)